MDMISNIGGKDMLLKHIPWSKELPNKITFENLNIYNSKN